MRVYIVSSPDADLGCVAICADKATRAKYLAMGHDAIADYTWTEVTVKWIKGIDVTGWEEGEIPLLEGLDRGVYNYVFGLPCPHCGADEPELRIYKEFCQRCESGADIDNYSPFPSDREQKGVRE